MFPGKKILCIYFVVTVSKKKEHTRTCQPHTCVDPAQLLEAKAAGSRHVKGMTGCLTAWIHYWYQLVR